MKSINKSTCLQVAIALILAFTSCKKKEEALPKPSPSKPGVPVNPKPEAKATYTGSKFAPVLVTFNNQSLNSNAFRWYLNNKPVSSEQHPEFLLDTVGTYTIRLVARNAAGDSSSKDFPIQVEKDPLLFHHFAFSDNFYNSGSSNATAGSLYYEFAPDRKQKPNAAIYLNGINAFVMIPLNLAALAPDSMSVSMWFKPENLSASGVVMGYQSSALNRVPDYYAPVIYYRGSGLMNTGFWHGQFASAHSVNASPGQWMHIVISANSLGQDVYINGEKVRSIPGRITDAHLTAAYIGATYLSKEWTGKTDGNNYFKGWIDDVRIYKRKLNALEVKSLSRE